MVAILYNINRKEHAPALDWTDVFDEWKEPEEMDPEEVDTMILAWAQARSTVN